MDRKPVDTSKNRVKGVHTLSAREMAVVVNNAQLANVSGKGRGVVARQHLLPGTFVGSMTGLVFTRRKWDNMVRKGQVTGKYGMALPKGLMVDVEAPMTSAGEAVIIEGFNQALGFMFNEPGPHQRVNAVFVQNHSVPGIKPRVDVYTMASIPAGGEITVHYGDAYKNNRTYPDPVDPQPLGVGILVGSRGEGVWEGAIAAGWNPPMR